MGNLRLEESPQRYDPQYACVGLGFYFSLRLDSIQIVYPSFFLPSWLMVRSKGSVLSNPIVFVDGTKLRVTRPGNY